MTPSLPIVGKLRLSDLKLVGIVIWIATLPLVDRINRLLPAPKRKKLT